MMAKYLPTIIVDAGHGGIVAGEYVTPGKRSPEYEWGQVFEGVFNRVVAELFCELLNAVGVPYFYLDTNNDVPLKTRVDIYNQIAKGKGMCYGYSIHANAASSPNATGVEVFTYHGQSEADEMATEWVKRYKVELPGDKMRMDNSDKDPDKESGFYILKNTSFPFILVEHLFMTNESDAQRLASSKYQATAANVLFTSCIEFLSQKGFEV